MPINAQESGVYGPGITGIVALGDTENVSPPICIIGSDVEAPVERLAPIEPATSG